MSKLTTDSKWTGLTEEQRDTVEGWLFEENITYREALERAQKEFGITASVSSIARLYQKMSDERLEAELAGFDQVSEQIIMAKNFELEDLSAVAMKLMANRLVQTARNKPGKVKEIVSLARALTQCQSAELKMRWYEFAQHKYVVELDRQKRAAAEMADFRETMKRLRERRMAAAASGGNAQA